MLIVNLTSAICVVWLCDVIIPSNITSQFLKITYRLVRQVSTEIKGTFFSSRNIPYGFPYFLNFFLCSLLPSIAKDTSCSLLSFHIPFCFLGTEFCCHLHHNLFL
jgi:hypothetical protein